jgi:HSP20 family protein
MMNNNLRKWNPFKFLRGEGRQSDAASGDGPLANDQWRAPWRAVEEFLHDPFAGPGVLERWFGDFSSSRFRPRIDVVDEGPVLRITAELPGMEREDLNVTVEDGALVLRGKKKQDVRSGESGCYRLERDNGSFVRTIPIPEDADPHHTLAKFDNGVLTLTLPKTETLRTTGRTIEIY